LIPTLIKHPGRLALRGAGKKEQNKKQIAPLQPLFHNKFTKNQKSFLEKNLFAAREFVDGVFCVIFDVRSLGFYPKGKEKEAPFNSQ